MTPKPSATNCPKLSCLRSAGFCLFRLYIRSCVWIVFPPSLSFLWFACFFVGGTKDISGGYCTGAPPLPIPNREVKPGCADGTALQCGRVGGRLFFEGCSPAVDSWRGSFFHALWHGPPAVWRRDVGTQDTVVIIKFEYGFS